MKLPIAFLVMAVALIAIISIEDQPKIKLPAIKIEAYNGAVHLLHDGRLVYSL